MDIPLDFLLSIAQIIVTVKMQQKRLQLPKERPSAFSRAGTFCADVAMGIPMFLLL